MQEIKDFFEKRTEKHIKLVQKYAEKVINSTISKNIDINLFKKEVNEHDASKYKDPEYEPYLHITWDYKLKDEGKEYKIPEKVRNNMDKASEHHLVNNSHHPEYWIDQKIEMSLTSIAHMVSDWMSMSEEKSDNPYDWAKENINKKWKFTKEQEKFIYNILDEVWG